jgi:hypothetical protein
MTSEKHSRAGEKVNIVPMDVAEQVRRLHAVISRRAFEIYENRGPGARQQEDWRLAETALIRPLCIGRMSLEDSLWISANAAAFEEGSISIWVAPKRITICGKPRGKWQAEAALPSGSQPHEQLMFRVVNLPVEIDPLDVTASFKGQFLELLLKKVQAVPELAAKAAA